MLLPRPKKVIPKIKPKAKFPTPIETQKQSNLQDWEHKHSFCKNGPFN